MDGLNKSRFGVTDVPRMRKANACFADGPALLRGLERTPRTLLLRPEGRGDGK